MFPYALFDHASLKYRQGKLSEALALLDRVNKFSGFEFEYRLYLRSHLLRKQIEYKTGAADNDGNDDDGGGDQANVDDDGVDDANSEENNDG